MEITLSTKQIHQIADKTAKIILRQLKNAEPEDNSRLVNVREAARLLGISETHMRSIKEEYPYIRRGKNQLGKIYFVRDALLASLTKTEKETTEKG